MEVIGWHPLFFLFFVAVDEMKTDTERSLLTSGVSIFLKSMS